MLDPQIDKTDQILEAAHRAYARGDYAGARGMAERLSRPDIPVPVREGAKRLLDKTGPDRVAVGLFLACMVFLVVVVLGYMF